MINNVISKAIKGKEFIYSKKYLILCKNEKQANELAAHLNTNDIDSVGVFKLGAGEVWQAYKLDEYDAEPVYKVKVTKNKISLTYNN